MGFESLNSIVSFLSSIYDFLYKVVGCDPMLILAVLLTVTATSRLSHVRVKYRRDKNLILGSMSFVYSFIFIALIKLEKTGTIVGDTFSQTLRLGAVASFVYQITKSYAKLLMRILLKTLADRVGVVLTASEMKTLEEDSEGITHTVDSKK